MYSQHRYGCLTTNLTMCFVIRLSYGLTGVPYHRCTRYGKVSSGFTTTATAFFCKDATFSTIGWPFFSSMFLCFCNSRLSLTVGFSIFAAGVSKGFGMFCWSNYGRYERCYRTTRTKEGRDVTTFGVGWTGSNCILARFEVNSKTEQVDCLGTFECSHFGTFRQSCTDLTSIASRLQYRLP